MLFELLFQQPMMFVAILTAVVLAITVHEFAHAYSAYLLGDPTAQEMGRVTLNPVKHLTLLGTLMLLLAGFGWGKPVPVNPFNLKYGRWGNAIVSLAGPAANLILALVVALTLRLILAEQVLSLENLMITFLYYLVLINCVLLAFNLIPIPPLDGSKVLFAALRGPQFQEFKAQFSQYGPMVLIFLVILDNFMGFNIFGHLFQWVMNLANLIVFP